MVKTNKKLHIITAAEINAQKEAAKNNQPLPQAAELGLLRNEKVDLTKQNEALTTKVKMLEATRDANSPSRLRQMLDGILTKNGINAAFEPLVELALERWPDDHPTFAGQLVCSVDQRIKIWTELLSYQLPKLKAIEMAGQVDHSLTVVIRRFGEGDAIIERAAQPQQAIDIPVTVKEEKNDAVRVKKF